MHGTLLRATRTQTSMRTFSRYIRAKRTVAAQRVWLCLFTHNMGRLNGSLQCGKALIRKQVDVPNRVRPSNGVTIPSAWTREIRQNSVVPALRA